jgi:hypothetical protein
VEKGKRKRKESKTNLKRNFKKRGIKIKSLIRRLI